VRFTREQIDRMEQRGNIKPADAEFLRGGDRNKYRVAPKAERTWNGRVYASKAEMLRAKELTVLESRGELMFKHQPRYTLGVKENVFIADFEVMGRSGRVHTEDVKGVMTPKFRRDRRLWAEYGPHDLVILKRKGSGWIREVVKGGNHDTR